MNFYIAAVTAVATLLSANLSYAQTNQHVAAAASSRVGFYHWGGQRAGDFLKGMEHLRELNARVARITLSARMDVDYRNGAVCINNYSLPTILERPEVRRAVTEPQLDVVMITAYDGLGFSDCMTHAYLSLAHYTAENTARVVQEYS
ncbi:MAG: hypothetical protein H7Y20_03675, partial [Bryobacteraceae bacterium]|nr:hypothetical protein [Bryobacteraceae bacterium]